MSLDPVSYILAKRGLTKPDSREAIKDFFAPPFWDNIPDKPPLIKSNSVRNLFISTSEPNPESVGDLWIRGEVWPYRQAITISNSNSEDLTDFQVKLELNANNVGEHFDWSRKGADLRFRTPDGTRIPYYVESWDETNKQAVVWVKVPSIPASGSTTIYMYYGNPSAASESDGESVFEFFDDFNDLSKWRVIRSGASGYPKVEDSYLKIKSTSSATTVDTKFSLSDVIVDAKVHVVSNGEALMIGATDGTYSSDGLVSNGYDALWDGYPTTDERQRLRRFSDNSCTILAQTGNGLLQNGNTYITSFVYASPTLKMLNDYGEILSATDSTYTSRDYLSISCWAGSEYWIDWIRVRKYAEQEPSVQFGAEEEASLIDAISPKLWNGSEWVGNIEARSIYPEVDNTYSCGSPSSRWKNVYAVNVQTGDVVFQNGWRITEFDENGKLMDGLRVLNKGGAEILRIAEDGLYFKGKKIGGGE